MTNIYNFAQLTNSDRVIIRRTDKIDYKSIAITGAITPVTGTDLGMVRKTYSFKTLNCSESSCANKARDFSTTVSTVDVPIEIPYSTLDVANGAINIQYATDTTLTNASVTMRVYVSGDSANFNEYVVTTGQYIPANTPYSATIRLVNEDGLPTPTAIGGTGLGTTGTPVVELIVNDVVATTYTLSLLSVSFIPDVFDLNCEQQLSFGCLNTVEYTSGLETVAKRCSATEYSTAVVEEELTIEALGLAQHFLLLDPRAVLEKNAQVGRIETAQVTMVSKTINGVDFGAYQLPSTFIGACNFTSVELTNCGGNVNAELVCITNASQELNDDEYMLYVESSASGDTYWLLTSDNHIGESLSISYTVLGTGCLVTYDDGIVNDATFEIIQSFKMIDNVGNKKNVEVRIQNVKPTSFPTINLSSDTEVANTLTFKFKRSDVSIDMDC